MDKTNTLGEAPAIAFTNFKRIDGFEVSITLRGENGTTVLEKLGLAIEQIKKEGGTPVVRNSGGKREWPVKPVEYVEGRMCPTCGEKLVYATKKDGSKYIKCSTNKWMNNQVIGCPYIDWGNKPTIPGRQVSEEDYGA